MEKATFNEVTNFEVSLDKGANDKDSTKKSVTLVEFDPLAKLPVTPNKSIQPSVEKLSEPVNNTLNNSEVTTKYVPSLEDNGKLTPFPMFCAKIQELNRQTFQKNDTSTVNLNQGTQSQKGRFEYIERGPFGKRSSIGKDNNFYERFEPKPKKKVKTKIESDENKENIND